MTLIDTLKQALAALEECSQDHLEYSGMKQDAAITSLGQQIEALESVEPDDIEVIEHVRNCHYKIRTRHHLPDGTKLFTHPAPQAEKQRSLTQTEIVEAFCKLPHSVQYVSVFEAGARWAEKTLMSKHDPKIDTSSGHVQKTVDIEHVIAILREDMMHHPQTAYQKSYNAGIEETIARIKALIHSPD